MTRHDRRLEKANKEKVKHETQSNWPKKHKQIIRIASQ